MGRLTPVGDSPWRQDLGDPELRGLLRQADLGALDIKIALARLERAQAEVDLARAAAAPQLAVGAAGAVGGRTFASRRAVGSPTLEVAYDFDIYGRIARLRKAAALERTASAHDLAEARLLVAAETARAYVALCAASDSRAAAARRQASAARAITLVRVRVSEGVATARDLDSRAAADDAAAMLDRAARVGVATETARLAALTGVSQPPAPACATGSNPTGAETVAANVDSRPDVQAALARLRAADFRRAAAVAAERPQFQISAALGAPDAAVSSLLGTGVLAWALVGRIGETLLDGGAGHARIRIAASEADLADLAYRKAVLQGWTELKLTTMAVAAADENLAAAQRAGVRAQSRHDTLRIRGAQGVADGLALADAEEGLEQARDVLRQARLGAAEARIARGLAGGGR